VLLEVHFVVFDQLAALDHQLLAYHCVLEVRKLKPNDFRSCTFGG
jgi:hypothetical protein